MDAHPNPRNRADPDLILSTPLPKPSAAASATRSLTTDTASPIEPLCSASGPRNRALYSKKNTLLLCDWWLLWAPEAHEGRRLSVGGRVAERYKGSCQHKGDRSRSKFLRSPWQKAERVFKSAPITKRYDSFTLGTADGITLRIQGVINKKCSHQNGISLEVCNLFLIGFPYNWDKYAGACFEGKFNSASVSESAASANEISEGCRQSILVEGQDLTPPWKRISEKEKYEKERIRQKHANSSNHVGDDYVAGPPEAAGCYIDGLQGDEVDAGNFTTAHIENKVIGEANNVPSSENKPEPDNCIHLARAVTRSDDSERIGQHDIALSEGFLAGEVSDTKDGYSSRKEMNPLNISLKPVMAPQPTSESSENNVKYILDLSITKSQNHQSKQGKKKKQSPLSVYQACKKGRSLHSSGTTVWRPSYDNQYPLTRDTAKKLSIASPESLNLKRSRSGRLLVPPIARWCQKIIYAANGEIKAIAGEGLENFPCIESQAEPRRKRKRLV